MRLFLSLLLLPAALCLRVVETASGATLVEGGGVISHTDVEWSPEHLAAMLFLLEHLPLVDKTLPQTFLEQNVVLAMKARRSTAWAAAVPWPIFLNYVLPHASLDEPRDGWRPLMIGRFTDMVAEASSLAEAAMILNRDIWKIWGIHFVAGQTPAIMSPSQVIKAGYASCTGLSLFLVDALRSVGIPARVVGTPDWLPTQQESRRRLNSLILEPEEEAASAAYEADIADEMRNHNWVEVWDGAWWSFVGAAEYDSRGFNRTWFFPQPAKGQVPGDRLHAIYATSYEPAGTKYPLAWNWDVDWVNADDVTQTYIDAEQPTK